MPDLDDLYQEIILDHSRRPRNFGHLNEGNARAEGYNPLCGDRVTIELKLDGGVIRDVAFQGSGCAISTASASLMTERLRGKSVAEAETLFTRFHDLVAGDGPSGKDGTELGKLEAFSGVREFPARVKCATLAWHTLRAALRDPAEATPQISTE
jgi:nitrogen fixation NifU-like protein